MSDLLLEIKRLDVKKKGLFNFIKRKLLPTNPNG